MRGREHAEAASHIRLGGAEPVPASRVIAEPFTSLLMAGIVNPFGPTVNAVGALGVVRPGATLPVVALMLNPFSQQIEKVGSLVVGHEWNPAVVIPALFGLPFGCCPSLLLPNEQLDPEASVSLHARFLRGFADSREVLSRVRDYYGNPWDRVSSEMKSAATALAGDEDGDTEGGEPLSEAESLEMAALLLSDRHASPEVQALFYAWKGSIDHIGGPAMATMPFDVFTEVIEHLCGTVRVPPAPGWRAS